jgi:Type 9 secretion system plug protein 1st domain
MSPRKIAILLIAGFTFICDVKAQIPDTIYADNIRTVRLFNYGNQLSYPIISLNSGKQLELDFDDLDADVKYYYYSYVLCDVNWVPVDISPFDYISGFSMIRINNYRASSVALTQYTHYQALLPDKSGYPTMSGNYILKVFLDGDTSQVVFIKRFMVVDNKASIMARVVQPYDLNQLQTHQRLQFTVGFNSTDAYNIGQQVKVVILQNYRWDNALTGLTPTFNRGNSLEYNSEGLAVFPGGKEWRWLDIRDFHLQGANVLKADYNSRSTNIYLRPDAPRDKLPYTYYHDNNGMFISTTTSGINPLWEADYATVYFSFAPPGGVPYPDKDIYLFGQLTNYNFPDSLKMIFNPERRVYETHLLLKQGFYDYTYLAVDKNDPSVRSGLDGNSFETENMYTILVYYKSFTDRADELIGVANIDSRTSNPNLNF